MPGAQVHVQNVYDTERLKTEKQKQRQSIFDLVDKRKNIRPKNIAIIGCTGVGKSSLINTIAAALSDTAWRELSMVEPRHQSVTMGILRIPKEEYMEKFKEHNMPTLTDLIGFQNENSEIVKLLLELVLNGRLPDKINLEKVNRGTRSPNGLNRLKAQYSKDNPEMKIDIVIFVASATSMLPINLINAVLEVATTKTGSISNRDIPIFGVLTKCDKINEHRLRIKEKEFMDLLEIQTNRYTRMTNYCDDVDKKYHMDRRNTLNYHIDVNTLLFLKQVCDPAIRVRNEPVNERGFDIVKSSIVIAILAFLVFLIQTII